MAERSVFLTPAAFLLRDGGVRRMAVDLAAALEGVDVDVATVVDRNRPAGPAGLAQQLVAQARQQRAVLRDRSPQVVHSIYYDVPVLGSRPLVVTVHDMIHERFSTGSRRLRAAKRRSVRRASIVVCVSQRTADDLRAAGADRRELLTIPHGVSDDILHGTEIASPFAGAPYLLYVGDRAGYKNFDLLSDTLAASPELDRYGLVVVGGSAMDGAALDRLRARRRNAGAVIHLPGVDDVALGALYRGAAALVVTSRYEGFGLPLVEAMACGCAVASTGGGSLTEIADGHAFAFDPDSTRECRAAIHRAVESDAAHRQDARDHAMGFTWRRAALAYRDVYDRLSAGRGLAR